MSSRLDGMHIRCGRCVYCDGAYGTNSLVGNCKKNSPVSQANDKQYDHAVGPRAQWPQVDHHSDWCGEFEARRN